MFGTLTKLLNKKSKQKKTAKVRRNRSFRPAVEAVEDRRMMAVLLVDDNNAQFPNAGFNNIQAAVNAANTGDVVLVAPGSYTGGISINKQLTLQGAFQFNEPFNPNKASVVVPAAGQTGISIAANNVVIQGMTVSSFGVNAAGSIGIYASPATSGYVIAANIVQDNSIGIYANSSGASASVISGNWIRRNNDTGAAGGNGVYSDQGANNIFVTGNQINANNNSAVNFANDGSVVNTNITVDSNQVGNEALGVAGGQITMVQTTNSRVRFNTIYRPVDANGIQISGGNSDLTVQGNNIRFAGFSGIQVGTFFNATPDTNVKIIGNTVYNSADGGIRLRLGTNNTLVQGNTTFSNRGDTLPFGVGIGLETGATNNRIIGNTSFGNLNGISVDGSATNNTLIGNSAFNNIALDLRDDSAGAGTAGTANTWTGNYGPKRNKAGIGVG